jgi:hypothetical protein
MYRRVAVEGHTASSRLARVVREVYVGFSAANAIIGNKMAPGLGDAYLARTGYASQQTAEPAKPDRPNNLDAPVDAKPDVGTHGRGDDQARNRSWYLCVTMHKPLVASAALAVASSPRPLPHDDRRTRQPITQRCVPANLVHRATPSGALVTMNTASSG